MQGSHYDSGHSDQKALLDQGSVSILWKQLSLQLPVRQCYFRLSVEDT